MPLSEKPAIKRLWHVLYILDTDEPKPYGNTTGKVEIMQVKSKRLLWKTNLNQGAAKPFLTDKMKISNDFISLRSGDEIINDPVAVCNEFNIFFANVALNIGRNDNISLDEDILSIADSYSGHPSIENNKHHMSHLDNFDFKEVSQNEVRTLLKGLNPKKSPGYDHVPPKLLNIAAEEMSIPLTPLINSSIRTASFPDQLKLAELSPLFKNNDSLLTGNYRQVSVLTCISKVFEKV